LERERKKECIRAWLDDLWRLTFDLALWPDKNLKEK